MTAATVAATLLKEKVPPAAERPSRDWPAFDVPVGQVLTALQVLRDDGAYDMLVDVTAIDGGAARSPRFTVVWHLLSTSRHAYVRVAADCPDDAHPSMPSATGLWPAANWHEREAYDMFGIGFEGHPDLRRILMWDGYPYFPLRKEFPLAGLETELPDPAVAEETAAKVQAAPLMGGPFVANAGPTLEQAEPRAGDESWTEHQEKPH